MAEYQSYRDRIYASGQTRSESVTDRTKMVQLSRFNSSETLSKVKINDDEAIIDTIVSRVKTEGKYDRNKFLFKPNTPVYLGDMIYFGQDAYLAIEWVDDPIYPELTGKRCNTTFPLRLGQTKTRIGFDAFNKPIYKVVEDIKDIPAIVDKKGYNIIDNSPISLPDGFINVFLHYDPNVQIFINYEFKIDGSPYKVTDVSYENIYNNKGFLEIRAEKVIG